MKRRRTAGGSGAVLLWLWLAAGCYATRSGGDEPGPGGGDAARGGICTQGSCSAGGQAGRSSAAGRPATTAPPGFMPSAPMTTPMTQPPGMSMPWTPPGVPEPMACVPPLPLQPACARCACSASPECASALTYCDRDCWALMSCVFHVCGNQSNISCIVEQCSAYLSASMRATIAAPCVRPCMAACAFDLGRPSQQPDPDADAGVPL